MTRAILTLTALFCLVLGFQNCAPSRLEAPGESAEKSAATPGIADHDPLKPSADAVDGALISGQTYVLDAVYASDRTYTVPGEYRLRFASAFEAASGRPDSLSTTVLKKIAFAASGCSFEFSGEGSISRYRDLPLKAGYVGFLLQAETLGSACGAEFGDGASVFNVNAYKSLLKNADSYIIAGDRLFIVADGGATTANFRLVNAEE